MRDHLFIPDTQVHQGVPLAHLSALGNLIVDRRPDVIVMIGDWADMPSLSSYDVGRRSFEGRRYTQDVDSSRHAMSILLEPLRKLQARQRRNKSRVYNPFMVLTLGNHEDRITRATQNMAQFEGAISIDDLGYEEFGWAVIPFLQPIEIDGVTYVHYVQNDNSPNAIGRAHLISARRHGSFSCGHKPGLDYYVSAGVSPSNNRRVQSIITGSFYMHDEDYRGHQGNQHWRGVVYKHGVEEGEYDPEFVSIRRLLAEYG